MFLRLNKRFFKKNLLLASKDERPSFLDRFMRCPLQRFVRFVETTGYNWNKLLTVLFDLTTDAKYALVRFALYVL